MDKSKGHWLVRTETILLRTIVFFIIILLLSQALLLKEETRYYLSKVDRMEGNQLNTATPLYADLPLEIREETTVINNYQSLLRKSKVVFLHVVRQPENVTIYVLVNGKRVNSFRKGDSKVTVYNGDYLEIDATELEQSLQFIINIPEKDLLSPADGVVIEGCKGILSVGKIKFKDE